VFNYAPTNTLVQMVIPDAPQHLVGENAYDSDLAAIRNIRNSLRGIPKLRLAPLIFQSTELLMSRSVPTSS
jgi:hypothetical protein